MNRVSCIVPVYQVEKYLRKCIDSLLNQTIAIDEIILVDDNSSDRGGGICDEYACNNSNIVVIHNDKNMGASYSRNAGLEKTTGDYVVFVDSDDIVSNTYIEDFLNVFDNLNVSFVQCGLENFEDDDELSTRKETGNQSISILSNNEIIDALYGNGDTSKVNFTVWNKMYKREFIDGILFEEGKECEDVIFISELVLNKGVNCALLDNINYYYRQRTDSVMGRLRNNELDMIGRHIIAYSEVVRKYNGSDSYVKECLQARLANWYSSAIKRNMLKSENAEIYKRFYEDRKRYSFMKNKRIALAKRIALMFQF